MRLGNRSSAACRTDKFPADGTSRGRYRLPLHRPLLTTADPYIQWGVAPDGTVPEPGFLLRRHVATKVGWDPQALVDPAELRSECADELAVGSINGLVLCNSAR